MTLEITHLAIGAGIHPQDMETLMGWRSCRTASVRASRNFQLKNAGHADAPGLPPVSLFIPDTAKRIL
ncbi:MAG: hypothetical protein OXD44_01730 [Gammaproteobacteria bacterium]|nr:hypothetical protein [Gammaproteobacteria bacterium]MCY4228440.1 hypothetical protein [Gammaproteobacteria bacterium]MCY4312416.1 hypothetical protein [Gammaproteobacteria bacterium]